MLFKFVKKHFNRLFFYTGFFLRVTILLFFPLHLSFLPNMTHYNFYILHIQYRLKQQLSTLRAYCSQTSNQPLPPNFQKKSHLLPFFFSKSLSSSQTHVKRSSSSLPPHLIFCIDLFYHNSQNLISLRATSRTNLSKIDTLNNHPHLLIPLSFLLRPLLLVEHCPHPSYFIGTISSMIISFAANTLNS